MDNVRRDIPSTWPKRLVLLTTSPRSIMTARTPLPENVRSVAAGVCIELASRTDPSSRSAMKTLLMSIAVALALAATPRARAAEITLIGPGGIRAAVGQMIPDFEKKAGQKVRGTSGSGGGTKARLIRGGPFDVQIVQLPLEPVIASGHVVAASQTLLASVWVGIAVKAGTPKPDIATA